MCSRAVWLVVLACAGRVLSRLRLAVSAHNRDASCICLGRQGADLAVIALWLGHSSPAVTHQYLEADLAAKEAVLQRLTDPSPTPTRFHPGDQLLAFLQDL